MQKFNSFHNKSFSLFTYFIDKIVIYICHFKGNVQLKVQSQWTRWLNYIPQNFSWESLLAMQVNLSFFCISSTYDTLISLSNLKRWKVTTQASFLLCNKDACTTSHILGTWKVALSQGRFTFPPDSVWRIIITSIGSFIKTIKSTLQSKP